MDINLRRAGALFTSLTLAAVSYGATYGTVVPVRGTVSDIALDERHGNLYIANFTANRIEVMNLSDHSFKNSMAVFMPPSAVAVSPDNRYLVVGHDNSFSTAPDMGGFTVFDLDANTQQQVAIGNPVLSVAFGSGSQALVVTTGGLMTLDPGSARTTTLPVNLASGLALGTVPFPVGFANFPGNIIQASTGVSGDGNTIFVQATACAGNTVCGALAAPPAPDNVAVIRYTVGASSATVTEFTSTPLLGPRSIAVDQTGQNVLAGWTMTDPNGVLLAQFPAALGTLNIGANAWDNAHNRIFAQIPATGDGAVLHVADTDNLTIRERIQLPQDLSGRTLFSSDQQTLYAASVSGVTIFPVGSFDSAHRVSTLEEDLLFEVGVCVGGTISQYLDVVDLGGGSIDFTLSLPTGTAGITLSQVSGTTPARVRINVDPTVYAGAKGTTTVSLSISSSGAINLPSPVRLLINTHDVNQHGQIVDVPGTLTDMIADPVRKRVYITRQDKNLVLVYDTTTFTQIASMRTGNTPVGMAITTDDNYLIVGNDNSQIASVFDLNALQPTTPIVFPFGHYPRVVAVSNAGSFAIARTVIQQSGSQSVIHKIDRIDFPNRIANPPATLGIYKNSLSTPDGILTSSPSFNTIMMALSDGTVALYDASSDTFVASRQDYKALSGAFGSINDSLYLVDNHLLDPALVPIVDLENTTGSSSGMGLATGYGLRTTTASASAPGTLERIDLVNLVAFHGALTVEAPVISSLLKTPTVGQIGQTILSFTRTLAVPPDQSSTILLTQSGLTVVEPNFDSPQAIPSVSAVNNAADHGTDVAPGGLVVISGSALAPQFTAASSLPLPDTLGNVCVAVNNVSLPLFSVSTSQIMAQLPFTVTGTQPLVVRTSAGISNPFSLNIQSFAPAIFYDGTAGSQTGLAAVVRLVNNELVDFTNPIHPDETIAIYLTGMAQTSPAAPLGDAAPLNPLAIVSTPPTVTIGNTALSVTFAGLVPGEVGVYQIDAYVPKGIQGAAQTSLVVAQGGASKSLQVRVVNP